MPTGLRICAITPSLADGGGERSFASVVNGLAKRGHEIHVMVPSDAPVIRLLDSEKGLDVTLIDGLERDGLSNLLRHLPDVRRAVWNSRADVVYGNAYVSAKWVAGIGLGNHVPTVVHLRESLFDPYGSTKAWLTARRLDRIIAISKFVGDQFAQRARYESNRIKVIPNGVESSVYADSDTTETKVDLGLKFNIPAVDPWLVLAGREDPLKGHDTAVKAMSYLKSYAFNFQLIFVGVGADSNYGKKLLALAKREGIADSLHLMGWQRDIRRWMADADLVVVPSLAEGFGRVVIEAMAEGTPVVASDVGGIPEIIEDGVSGILVPPGNPQMLANAIATCHHKPDYRRQLAEGGSLRFRQSFSEGRMVAGVEEVLLRAVRG